MTTFDIKPKESLFNQPAEVDSSSIPSKQTKTIQKKPSTKLKVVPKKILEKMKREGLIPIMKATNNIKNLKVVKIIKPAIQNNGSNSKSEDSKEKESTNTSEKNPEETQNAMNANNSLMSVSEEDSTTKTNFQCLDFQTSLDTISKRRSKRSVRNFISSNSEKNSFSELKKQYLIKNCQITLKRIQDLSH